eukprot:1401591-Amphidinium_carterae.1
MGLTFQVRMRSPVVRTPIATQSTNVLPAAVTSSARKEKHGHFTPMNLLFAALAPTFWHKGSGTKQNTVSTQIIAHRESNCSKSSKNDPKVRQSAAI